MLDTFTDQLNARTLLLGALAITTVYYVVIWVRDELKIRRLGGHAPTWTTGVPFGADFIRKLIKSASRNENLQFWDDVFMKYGRAENPYTVEGNGGGHRVIFTADHENIKAILATQFNDYGKGERFHNDWYEFLGDSIFNTDHELWQKSRQLIRPQFIKDRVSDLHSFEKHVSILLPKLGGDGQEVDVKDLFFRYTLDAATDFLLGRSAESLEHGETRFATAFAEVQRIQQMIARAGPLNVVISRSKFREHLKVMNDFIETYIDDALRLSQDELEKRTKSEAGYTFLHALASYTRDRKVLRDQIVAVLLAGRDTTACTLSWIFYELGKNEQIVRKLRQEVENVVGFNREPTYDDLKSMKYLQNTMNEALRLYPVVPYNVRTALKDTTLPRGAGAKGDEPMGILKGTPVGYSTHYMQLTQEIYPATSESFPSPKIFAPERWEKWQPKSWTYIPFNGGPRICVGQQFALTEMGYTIVRVLQRFKRFEARDPPARTMTKPPTSRISLARQIADSRTLQYKSEIVLQPAEPVWVTFHAN